MTTGGATVVEFGDVATRPVKVALSYLAATVAQSATDDHNVMISSTPSPRLTAPYALYMGEYSEGC